MDFPWPCLNKVTSRDQHGDVEEGSQFGFQDSEVIELLGVAIPFEGPWRLAIAQGSTTQGAAAPQIAGLDQRASTPPSRTDRFIGDAFSHLVRSFEDMPSQDLATIKNEILNSVENIFKVNAARALIFETVGWQLEPFFVLGSAEGVVENGGIAT